MGGPHQHCPCNLVTVCRVCHSWAEANFGQAQGSGFRVSVHAEFPEDTLVAAFFGNVRYHCDGTITEYHRRSE